MKTLDEHDLDQQGRLPDDPLEGTEPMDWEPPLEFAREGVPPEPPPDILPSPYAQYVRELAAEIRVPSSLPFMMVLVAISTAVAGKIKIRIHGKYFEPLNIFVVVAMPPASGKSPVFKRIIAPIYDRERELGREHEQRLSSIASRRRILESKLAAAEQSAAQDQGEHAQLAKANASELARQLQETPIPARPRLVVDDTTPEKMAILMEQEGRLAQLSAEGGPFYNMRRGHGGRDFPDLDLHLKAWSGDPHPQDRVTRETLYLSDPCLTMGLTVQPSVLESIGHCHDMKGRGLVGRCLWAVPDTQHRAPPSASRPVSDAVERAYQDHLSALLRIPMAKVGAPRPELTLEEEARQAFHAFNDETHRRIHDEDGDLGAMPDWAGKLQSQYLRIAGLLHLARHGMEPEPWSEPVSRETMDDARRIIDLLIPHARLAYQVMELDNKVGDARYALRWIARMGRPSFVERDAYHGMRSRFPRIETLRPILRRLEDHHYIHRVDAERPGLGRPPSPAYIVNPLWKL